MLLISSPIPSICISPASPEKSHPQPYSPFPSTTLDIEDDDGFRANRLSVPHSANTSPWHPSPLRPRNCPPPKGLNRDQFDSLLKVSRDQRAMLKTQKLPDLRKELALKNQRLKQAERRALFLSRVKELPSTAKDYPDSPSITRCSSPLNGLGSPFSMLGSAKENPEAFVDSPIGPGCDSEVELLLPITKQLLPVAKGSSKLPPTAAKKSRSVAPSLDEITARLKPSLLPKRDTSRSRLPGFLKALTSPCGSVDAEIKTVPVRTLALNDEKFDLSLVQGNTPQQDPSTYTAKVELKTPVASRVVNLAPGSLSQSTQRASRAITAQDMMATLKRRNSPPPGLGNAPRTQTSKESKRHSAPAEVQHSGRVGFDHATLSFGVF